MPCYTRQEPDRPELSLVEYQAKFRVPGTIAVSHFVDLAELNPEYVEKPYFVTPDWESGFLRPVRA